MGFHTHTHTHQHKAAFGPKSLVYVYMPVCVCVFIDVAISLLLFYVFLLPFPPSFYVMRSAATEVVDFHAKKEREEQRFVTTTFISFRVRVCVSGAWCPDTPTVLDANLTRADAPLPLSPTRKMPFSASAPPRLALLRYRLRFGPGRHPLSPSGWVRSSRALVAATATSSTCSALVTAHRTYFWPYPDNFIPEGATTSAFQSSPVPSVRERIVREYALSPLFGRRIPCCVLGFTEPASTLVELKGELRYLVSQALGKPTEAVVLGPLRQTKEMMLHRSGTDESPRLGDGAWSRPDAERRRCSRYARLPVQARTLVEVYLLDEGFGSGNASSEALVGRKDSTTEEDSDVDSMEDEGDDGDAEAAIFAHGWFLQEQLYAYMTSRAATNGREEQPQPEPEAEPGEGHVEASIAALHDELGVVYCEVPAPDESGFLFDQLHGKEVDAETAARVVDRWTRRIAQQQQQEQEQEANKHKKSTV
jgi:hypothetical protein